MNLRGIINLNNPTHVQADKIIKALHDSMRGKVSTHLKPLMKAPEIQDVNLLMIKLKFPLNHFLKILLRKKRKISKAYLKVSDERKVKIFKALRALKG